MKTTALGIAIFFFLIGQALSADFYKLTYRVGPSEDFAEIVRTFVKDEAIIHSQTPMIAKTIKRNRHINDWENLKPGDEIDLYIDPHSMDFSKYLQYESRTLELINKSKQGLGQTNSAYTHGLKGAFFYLLSSGTFVQKSAPYGEAKFFQTSPLTLGASLAYYPRDSLFSTSMNLSYSSFNEAETNLNGRTIETSPELGLSLYEEYRLFKLGTTVFAGLDHENFSSFDLETLNLQQDINFNKNQATYFTAGLSKSVNIFSKDLLMKFSFSQSLFADQSSERANQTKAYAGNKILFYINFKFTERFFFHSQIKYHKMEGIDEISVFRLGIGGGYVLF